jgi:hypothetical protein
MLDGITWLDVISILLAIFTAIMTHRVESRQDAYLKDIRRREKEIQDKLEESKNEPTP